MPKTLYIGGRRMFVERHSYPNGRIALQLVTTDGLPWAVPTHNDPSVPLGIGQAIMKRRDGMIPAVDALQAAGIISAPIRIVRVGWALEPVVTINEAVLHEYTHGSDDCTAVEELTAEDLGEALSDEEDGDEDDGEDDSEPSFELISPDGLPCYPEAFETREEAEQMLDRWVKRYIKQGFYSTADRERIPVCELKQYCQIVPV